ncbi:CCA tRNA nucleotidyltransferase, mitochondrial [Morella rubra]|uniref:CCA tRNA nucleotidyltransferase, mitochondrial n=1 Tax=Morella rubra TaxID=262757 RepID=A0A6A1VB34_9ROSI|nr:CCA tRNA nucleotidyltransferase, mitochondrial [Morella rubra]
MATEISPPIFQVKEKIKLTETERKIFDRLLGTLRHFSLSNQLRVAGGWVRDKLLGKECYDIDIALDNMLGSEFVEKVREYLLSTGEEVQGVAVIPCNPEQSKHLETARMRLFDMWIDFVNLRCEEYSDNSRIPTKTKMTIMPLIHFAYIEDIVVNSLISQGYYCQIEGAKCLILVVGGCNVSKKFIYGLQQKFGTAEEDAYRRDLTINSLFYNINTDSVEDLTNRGIADLQSGKIVTPLPPKATFLDDPLRVLRAIRFGARFGFVLDEELKEAASCDEVKDALAAKISRERIGVEIDLMISGNQPVKAMTHICDLTLFGIVFNFPPNFEPPKSEGCDRLCNAYLDATWNLIQSIGGSSFNDEQRRLSLYAALFLLFRKTIYKDNKAKKIPVVNYIFRESLKRKASDAETVINIHCALDKFLSLIPFLVSNGPAQLPEVDWGRGLDDVPITSRLRVLTGLLLREIKDFWRVALMLSTLLYPTEVDYTEDFLKHQFQLDKRKDLFKAVESAISKLGLEKVWDVKPLVNGKDIMSVLQLKAGGPLIREWEDAYFHQLYSGGYTNKILSTYSRYLVHFLPCKYLRFERNMEEHHLYCFSGLGYPRDETLSTNPKKRDLTLIVMGSLGEATQLKAFIWYRKNEFDSGKTFYTSEKMILIIGYQDLDICFQYLQGILGVRAPMVPQGATPAPSFSYGRFRVGRYRSNPLHIVPPSLAPPTEGSGETVFIDLTSDTELED